MKNIQELFNLSSKVAIVTGGGQGIGKGIAMRLAEAGAKIVIADMNMDVAEKTAAALPTDAIAVKTDVASEADAVNMVKTAVDAFGSVDILVNNAGIYPMVSLLEMQTADWERVIGINLKGTFLCARESAKQMVLQGKGGRIINIASIDAFHPSFIGLGAYDSSKGGVIMFTKSLALELASHNILVNAIAPGGIRTPGASVGITEETTKAFEKRIPLHRMGEPDDIGKVALFLASDASSYMTGEHIIVDGGYLLGT